MKLVIERSAALEALSAVHGVAARRGAVPILSDVLLQAAGASLTFTCTDGDVEAVAVAPAAIADVGATAVSVGSLYDLLKSFPEGADVRLETPSAGAQLNVRCVKSRLKLPTLPAVDFPAFAPAVDGEVRGAIAAKDLARLIGRVAFAPTSDETRWMLTGLHFMVGDGRLRCVGAQPTMIAWADMPCPPGLTDMPTFTLGRKVFGEVLKQVTDRVGEVELAVCARRRFQMATDDSTLTSKVLDGDPIAWQHHFAPREMGRLTAPVGPMKAAIKRCLMATDDKARGVKLSVAGGVLSLTAKSFALGQAEEDIEVEGDVEAAVEFNGVQLLAILDQMTGDQADLAFGDPALPILVFDPKDPDCAYLTAPLRTS